MPISGSLRYLCLVFGLAAVYFAAARLGLLLQLPGTNASAVWPASGIGLAAVLLFGLRAWPGIALGAFFANLTTLPPTAAGVAATSAIAVGNTLEHVAALLILRRLVPSLHPFNHPHDLLRFLAASGLACAVASTFGATSLWLTGIVAGHLYASVWFTWWLGDAVGILVLTPAAVCWWRNPRLTLPAHRALELAAVAAVTGLTAELTFGGWVPVAVPLIVGVGPLWAAFRFGPRETALLPVLLSVITVSHVWHWAERMTGPGGPPGLYVPFVSGAASVNDSLLMLQLFMCEIGIMSLMLAGVVAERNRTKDRLRDSESRFRTIFEQAAVGVALIETSTGRFIRVNTRYCELIGYSAEEITHTTLMAITHPEDLREDLDQMRRLVAGTIGEFVMEKRILHKNGSVVWTRMTVSPMWRPGETPECHIAIVEDVTERKLAEAERQKFVALADNSPEFIGMCDREFRPFYINAAGRKMVGLPSLDDACRVRVQDYFFPEDQPWITGEFFPRVLRDGHGEVEVRFRHFQTGEAIWMLYNVFNIRDAGGSPIGWATVSRNIHARRLAERQFRLAVEASPSAILLVDRNGQIVLVNALTERLFGYNRAELLGAQIELLVPSSVRVNHSGLRESFFANPTTRAMAGREVYGQRKDGTRFPVEISLNPIETAEGMLALATVVDITARKQAEEQFHTAVESSPSGMVMIDANGRIVLANRLTEQFFGYDRAELLGQPVEILLPERYRETHPASRTAFFTCPTVRSMGVGRNLWGRRKDGTEFPVEIGLNPVQLESGWHALASIIDISGKVAAERALRELNATLERRVFERTAALAANEALLRQFIKHAPAGIAMFDTDLRYIQASDRWLADYDLVGRDIIGKSHYEIFPEIPERWKAVHGRVLAGATERCDEDPFHRADGSIMWLQWECQPWYKVGGEVGGLIMFGQVITERKRAEEALRASEERYRAVVEDQTEVVCRFRSDGNFLFVNNVFCRTFGKTEHELIGTKWVPVAHPDDVPRVQAELARLAVNNPIVRIENRVYDGIGRLRWMEFVNRGFFDSRGELLEIQSVGRDITDRREAEELLRNTLAEKEVLLKEIHHRVKNNLQIVSSLLDLQSEHTTDPEVLEMFQESRGRVKSMALIHERLYRSQDMARVNFAEYVRQLANDLYRTYKMSDAEIRLDLVVDIPALPIDLAIPCGLLLNELMSNCFKHAFRDASEGTVRVAVYRDGDKNVIRVSDDGAGFPPGIDYRNTTSFGLQLVNTLVAQLAGEIELTTGPGTTFTVRFPAAKS